LHEGAEAGGVDEIDPAQIDHQRQGGSDAMAGDEVGELFVGVGVELAGETEQQALRLAFATPAQGDGQSLQVGDRSSPRSTHGRQCREGTPDCGNRNESSDLAALAQRRCAIRATNLAK
jgi:hypothetical protein